MDVNVVSLDNEISGILQGSVLDPILILLFLDNISNFAAEGCALNMYIDDHHGDFIMGTIASQITSLTIVYSTVYSGADQRKYQSSVSLAFVWGIHRDR